MYKDPKAILDPWDPLDYKDPKGHREFRGSLALLVQWAPRGLRD